MLQPAGYMLQRARPESTPYSVTRDHVCRGSEQFPRGRPGAEIIAPAAAARPERCLEGFRPPPLEECPNGNARLLGCLFEGVPPDKCFDSQPLPILQVRAAQVEDIIARSPPARGPLGDLACSLLGSF